jgi:putative membrane protein
MIALLQGGLLGALLVFARAPWYPAHAADSARWGAELLRDQQVAGLLMWIPASVVYLGAIAYLAHAALASQEAARPSPFRRQTATLPAGIFPR